MQQVTISAIKKGAKNTLRGKWFQPIWLLLISYLLTELVNQLISSAFDSFSFMYVFLLMLMNFFVLFAFRYGQYYYPMSVFTKQPFNFRMLFIGFSRFYYQRLVVLNFIRSVASFLSAALLMLPFIGKINLITFLDLSFGIYSRALLMHLSNVMSRFNVFNWFFLAIMFVIFALLNIMISGFFQVAAYLIFENARNLKAPIIVSALFLMRHQWVNMIKLQVSFVLWYLFYPVTFFAVIPYRQMSLFIFYLNLKQQLVQRITEMQQSNSEPSGTKDSTDEKKPAEKPASHDNSEDKKH